MTDRRGPAAAGLRQVPGRSNRRAGPIRIMLDRHDPGRAGKWRKIPPESQWEEKGLMKHRIAAGLLALAVTMGARPGLAQPAGWTPPEDIVIEATGGADGPVLSVKSVTLERGGYYRFDIGCTEDSDAAFSFGLQDFVADTHLRVLTAGGMEVYLQGMSFRKIQCDGPGGIRFSFYPMRKGIYEIPVTDQADETRRTILTVTVQ